jgi:hypothetical protein
VGEGGIKNFGSSTGSVLETPPGRIPYLLLHTQIYFCYSRASSLRSALESMTVHLTPDKTVPFPDSLDPEAGGTLRENMQIAANTAEVLKGLGAHVDDDPEAQLKAENVFNDFSELAKRQYEEAMIPKRGRGRPRKNPEDAPNKTPALMYSLPVAERIGTMLREYNNPIVADAAELRLVVTNKLLDLASCGDPKIEIKATEMLGKISDVGLFSEKTEITVTYNNVSDIDTAIKDKIRKMLMAQGVTDIAPIDIDLDREFGDP